MNGEATEIAEFAGDWVLELVLVTRATVPILGDFVTRTRSEAAVRLEVRDDTVWQTQRVCSTTVNDGRGLVRTLIPPAFVAAIPVISFPVALTRTPTGWSYGADFRQQRLGWDGDGTLPRPDETARLRDDDGDGHPGLTVLVQAPVVGSGEVYVVQSGRTVVSGIWSGEAFTGTVSIPELQQSVVGASRPMFLHAPTLVPDGPASRFRLTRGRASCAGG